MNVELNLSNNSLGANGANVLENCIGTVKCLTRLDLSENNLEAEMAGVMQGLAKNRSILSLNVSKNMTNIKTKYQSSVIESLVGLITNDESSINKLNLSDCKLKSDINNVINALGSNQSLQTLDISGNAMSDVGARLLAKALQINTRLKTINLDRNGISLQGYTDITYALQSNYSMRHIPFPTYDLQSVIKTHPERVDGVIHRMQELLQRNAAPRRLRNTAQAFRYETKPITLLAFDFLAFCFVKIQASYCLIIFYQKKKQDTLYQFCYRGKIMQSISQLVFLLIYVIATKLWNSFLALLEK